MDGTEDELDEFTRALKEDFPPLARIDSIEVVSCPPTDFQLLRLCTPNPSLGLSSPSHRMSPFVKIAAAKCSILATDATCTLSSIAPTAGRASLSSKTSPTTDPRPRWPPSRCARPAAPNTKIPLTGAFMPSRWPVPSVGRTFG